jgi:hypothetical protein
MKNKGRFAMIIKRISSNIALVGFIFNRIGKDDRKIEKAYPKVG